MTTLPIPTDLIDRARKLDLNDPLKGKKDLFNLPPGIIYLDGNSLGALPKGIDARLKDVIQREWGQDLITSWNKNGWMEISPKIGAKLERILGAENNSIRACDSTSINVAKALTAALSLNPDRRIVISERGNFPTDLYVTQQMLEGLGSEYQLLLIDDAETDLDEVLSEDIAVVLLTQVDYRSGRKLNMADVSLKIHDVGAITIWDLAHSAGAFAVNLADDGADFAIGCGYKFLNGGPGAPAFIYVSPQYQEIAKPILAGWLGHKSPFEFTSDYQPAPGINRYIIGTPPVLSLTALNEALDVMNGIEMADLGAKPTALGAFFIDSIEALCGEFAPKLASPREDERRGSQVSFHHPEGYAVMQALIAEGVIGDFRAPDITRFGFSPLYLSFEDVMNAAAIFADILTTGRWDDPKFKVKAAVT